MYTHTSNQTCRNLTPTNEIPCFYSLQKCKLKPFLNLSRKKEAHTNRKAIIFQTDRSRVGRIIVIVLHRVRSPSHLNLYHCLGQHPKEHTGKLPQLLWPSTYKHQQHLLIIYQVIPQLCLMEGAWFKKSETTYQHLEIS